MTDNIEKIVQEAECVAAADEYFKARTWLMDTNDNRRIFEAGFDRAYALLSKLRAPVAGEAHQEEWRPVVGFEGCYEASSLGAVRSISSGRVLSRNALAGDGYVKTDLHRGGVRTHSYLHRIVAEAFHGPAAGREVNHKNGDKLDNRAANLEWVTRAENEMHSRYVLGNLCSRVIAIHTQTGERIEFPSHAQAERELGINKDTVRRCLVGELKQTKGWRFERPAPQASEAVLQTILHSVRQARIAGNDWRRELALIENTVSAALSAQPGAQKGDSNG